MTIKKTENGNFAETLYYSPCAACKVSISRHTCAHCPYTRPVHDLCYSCVSEHTKVEHPGMPIETFPAGGLEEEEFLGAW